MNKQRRGLVEIGGLITPATVLITILFLFPLLNFLRTSFNQKIPGGSMKAAWSLENYMKFFTDPFFLKIMWNTIYIAFSATLLTFILAFPIAYLLARTNSKWKGVLTALVIFPLLVGNIVRDIGWISLFSERGLLNNLLTRSHVIDTPLEILGTPIAVIIATSNVVLPYMILSIQSVIEGVSPSLEEAAIDLGASKWTVIKTIVIPLAMPGILAGTLFVFILSMNAYTTPLIIGGTSVRMLAPALYSQITEVSNWPMGAAMAVVLILITLLSSIFYLRVIEKSSLNNVNANTGVKG